MWPSMPRRFAAVRQEKQKPATETSRVCSHGPRGARPAGKPETVPKRGSEILDGHSRRRKLHRAPTPSLPKRFDDPRRLHPLQKDGHRLGRRHESRPSVIRPRRRRLLRFFPAAGRSGWSGRSRTPQSRRRGSARPPSRRTCSGLVPPFRQSAGTCSRCRR